MKNLGLIVIDEEHENSYKQTETPKYHAREVALERAGIAGATVILGTATPSLESYFQARRGKYKLARLTQRVDNKVMPEVELVDMRREIITRGNRSIFSLSLQQAIGEKLERKEQIILFLNRRGFSPFILCRECGEVVRCKHCDVSFTYHFKTDRLHCHYCDYQEEKPRRFKKRMIFSLSLQQALREKLERKEQIILFLNRRGFSPFILCRECGEVVRCKHCDVSFTYHFKTDRLHCHYCDYQEEKPKLCPKCRSRRIGYLGVGTEKVESEVARLFPQAKLGRMDSDSTTGKGSQAKILTSFGKQGIDILIGTQMIAKGLDFPRVTLVGVVSADTALNLADFRASERTFQLLTQVAGRTGRGNRGGEVIIQTYNPEHYSIQSARLHDYEGFYRQEIKFRQELGYPPFRHLVSITLQSPNHDHLMKVAKKLGGILEAGSGEKIEVLGPTPAPISRLRSRWRWQILLKGDKVGELRDAVRESLARLKEPASGKVRISFDIDPLNML